MTVVENVQMALIAHARETYPAVARGGVAASRPRARAARARSAWRKPPTGHAASSPMAT